MIDTLGVLLAGGAICFSGWMPLFRGASVRADNSTLQVLTRSRYLDYVRANHGWFEAIFGPGKLYRICTEDDIVEVVACDPPTVQPATDTPR